MDDNVIIELYNRRDEAAITETSHKYGSFCRTIAHNILGNHEDALECVNDTYYAAWELIPPTIPVSLKAFLGRITRNLSVSRFRYNHAAKRYNNLTVMLSELDECIPSSDNVEQEYEQKNLAAQISCWLDTLTEEDRTLFVRRYWYGDEVKTLAEKNNDTPNHMAQHMQKLRKQLKIELEQKR